MLPLRFTGQAWIGSVFVYRFLRLLVKVHRMDMCIQFLINFFFFLISTISYKLIIHGCYNYHKTSNAL